MCGLAAEVDASGAQMSRSDHARLVLARDTTTQDMSE